MKESEFQKWVTDLFKLHGWSVHHAPTPMRPTKGGKFVPDSRGTGLLDLLLIHEDPPRLVFAEVKGHGGKLSDPQIEMLRRLRVVADEIKRVYAFVDPWLAGSPINPLGVYVFQPGGEPLIEAIARGGTA